MKKIFIMLLFTFLFTSCAGVKDNEVNLREQNEVSGTQKEMLGSPIGGGNTESLENDSFRN